VKPANLFLALYVALIGVLLFASPAHASTDPVKDTRQILAGTVTTIKAKNGYLSGTNDRTTAFQGALSAYKAVRAAEPPLPPMVTEAVPPLLPAPWTGMPTKSCASGQVILDQPGLVCNPRPPVPALTMHGVTFMGETAIPDNFDLSATSAVVYSDIPSATTWYGGLPKASGEGGNFRFTCSAGHLAKDDSLVHPGAPGASHLHQFWGNTQTNAFSNYRSLRTTGQSTCSNPLNGPANRTAYWLPAMLDGAGNAVKPDVIQSYYKQHAASDPACAESGQCIGVPNGLRYTFGYDYVNAATVDPANSMNRFECWHDLSASTAAPGVPGIFHTIDDAVNAGCGAGALLIINFVAPDCWNGVVDAPDHRSNMAYPTRATPTGFRCPIDHPYWTPNWSGYVAFTTDVNFVAHKWHLSSDEMVPGAPAGSTLHFDYWEAWSPGVKATWQFYCIDQSLNCAGGELGDGTAMNHDDMGPRPMHQLVPLSSIH
jgi:hypothetical protein